MKALAVDAATQVSMEHRAGYVISSRNEEGSEGCFDGGAKHHHEKTGSHLNLGQRLEVHSITTRGYSADILTPVKFALWRAPGINRFHRSVGAASGKKKPTSYLRAELRQSAESTVTHIGLAP